MAKRSKKNTHTVYITTKQEQHAVLFRVSNYFVLLSMLLLDGYFKIALPETAYILVVFAIVGIDVRALARRFFKKI